MFYGSTIGERLKTLRVLKGEKQQDVANAILVDRTVISFFERNERKPDAEKLIALANHFDVTTDFLLCRSDVKKADTTLQAVSKYTGLSDKAIQKIVLLKNLPLKNDIETLDDFICSAAFSQMLCAFVDTLKRIGVIYKNIDNVIEKSEQIKKDIECLKKNGCKDGDLETYIREMENCIDEIDTRQQVIEEQKDICSVKMIKVSRLFLDKY